MIEGRAVAYAVGRQPTVAISHISLAQGGGYLTRPEQLNPPLAGIASIWARCQEGIDGAELERDVLVEEDRDAAYVGAVPRARVTAACPHAECELARDRCVIVLDGKFSQRVGLDDTNEGPTERLTGIPPEDRGVGHKRSWDAFRDVQPALTKKRGKSFSPFFTSRISNPHRATPDSEVRLLSVVVDKFGFVLR